MIAWIKKLFTRQKPLDIHFVLDSEQNRSSNFWKSYIGLPVSFLDIKPDGLVDVQLHDQPISVQGIDRKRFT